MLCTTINIWGEDEVDDDDGDGDDDDRVMVDNGWKENEPIQQERTSMKRHAMPLNDDNAYTNNGHHNHFVFCCLDGTGISMWEQTNREPCLI